MLLALLLFCAPTADEQLLHAVLVLFSGAEGPERAMEAARKAISSPLLEGASVNGARGVIINVTGGPDLSLVEVSEASSIIQEAAEAGGRVALAARNVRRPRAARAGR